MDLTQEHFDQGIKALATKADIAAINSRIDSLPTQSDLSSFATKDDLLELSTKTDLLSLSGDIAELKAIVQRNFKTAEQDLNAVIKDVEKLKH